MSIARTAGVVLASGLTVLALTSCKDRGTAPTFGDSTSPASPVSVPVSVPASTPGDESSDEASAQPSTSARPTTTAKPTTVTPSASAKPTPSSKPSGKAPGAKREQTMGFNTLKLGYVTVTTSEGPVVKDIKGQSGIFVTVCVDKLPPGFEDGVPTSAGAWRFSSVPQGIYFPRSDAYSPALKPKTLTVGQCNKGFVSFDMAKQPKHVDGFIIEYHASFGDEGSWGFD